MADLAFPLATKLIEKLGSSAFKQICLAWGVKADLKKLQRTMSTIKDVLLDAEQKQAHNQQIRSWLRQLKDVFLDAEDLLDEFECEALRREVVETFHGTTGKVRRFFSRSNPIAFRFRVGNEIKEIRERLDELKSNKAIFDSLTILPHGDGGDHHERPFVPASKVIGRESEKEKIVNLLMQQGDDDQSRNSNNKVSVIPIVGIGGLGKTTLAKWVYDDKRVVGHFELRTWASVPVDFELTRLTRLILGSALDTEISDKLTLDQLQGRLRDALKDKKFLLVLDDVWNDDALKWSQLRDLVIEGAKSGSKILVTTRSTAFAEIMGTIPSNINLEFLSFEDCLSLFVECAFKEGRDKDYPNLFEMGKDIVRKCGGVPLAVKTLGSQLHSKTDEREWKLVRDSEIWKLDREDACHILPALRLSYTRLPHHLRQCLAYCSHLRKDMIRFSSFQLIIY
ncbi:putative disease resistance protein RGA4 [Prunus avium]|uniref:Disease resistance protein RGA4 n=1 Tax=Prunus avium TaxID=42229 RepID=A0A6P5S7Q4_PRUAV|nr:putative disease resistance protein RGA4 [Prunus avium]